jgi:hypothetical protein
MGRKFEFAQPGLHFIEAVIKAIAAELEPKEIRRRVREALTGEAFVEKP